MSHVVHYVGVDVSRRHLDIAIDSALTFRVPNDPSGYQTIISRVPPNSVICMESTGVYYRPLALYLQHQGHTVYVVNPYQVKAYSRMRLARVKTDKADAKLISQFIKDNLHRLQPWDGSETAIFALSLMVRFAEGLTVQRTGILNRLHAIAFVHDALPSVLSSASDNVATERERVYGIALDFVRQDELLLRWHTGIDSLPGFGDILALRFLAHAKDLRRFPSARHFASYTGLTPRIIESGQLEGRARISKLGPGGLRATLYLAARAAMRSKSEHGEYYRHLVKRGKSKQLALTALANRLARAAWAKCNT